MQKLGWYEFTAEGLSLERLLNQCAQQGVRLRGVKKTSMRAVTGSVAASDLQKLQALASARGWRLTVGAGRGMVRLGSLARSRALLVAGVLAFVMLCWGAVSCVWFIEIRGAGPYTGEVERILKQNDVRVGRFGFLIDTDALQAEMERELTGLAWVGVNTNGVRLTISCVQAQFAQGAAVQPGDLVASRDGVVTEMTVAAGTPAVKVGDVVRKGQVLVRGEERAWNGAVNPIRAQATVMARIWYTADAVVSGSLIASTPTGETFTRRTLRMPFYEYALEDAPAFSDFDREVTLVAIGGPFPIWVVLERYDEVTRTQVARDEEAVKEEAGLAAARLAQEKVEYGISVIDKWVEYSMMNDGGCRATAVVEAVADIAVAPDENGVTNP